MTIFRRAASAAVVLWLVIPAPAPAGAGDSPPLETLRAAYERTADLTARFLQDSHLVAAGLDRQARGRVQFKRGGKMRWTYEGDDPQEIVSDGETLWIHQVRDRTVLRQELAALPPSSRLALDLLSGFQGVESSFAVEGCGDLCLELRPRESRPDLTRVVLELAEGGETVRQVTTEDPLGNRTRVEFTDIRRNTGIPDEAFAFTVPDGVQVLEMQEAR